MVGGGRSSRFVWPPRRSPFKWRRTSAERLKSPRLSKPSAKLSTSSAGSSSFVWRSSTGAVLDGRGKQSVVSPRRPQTLPTAGSPGAVVSRYKWRRTSRLGSLGEILLGQAPGYEFLALSPGLPRPKSQLWILGRSRPGRFYSVIVTSGRHDRHLTSVKVHTSCLAA